MIPEAWQVPALIKTAEERKLRSLGCGLRLSGEMSFLSTGRQYRSSNSCSTGFSNSDRSRVTIVNPEGVTK